MTTELSKISLERQLYLNATTIIYSLCIYRTKSILTDCILPSNAHSSVQTTSTLVTNFVPNTTENMTFTINNQLTSQVQRLVRERPTTYDNLYQIYGGMFVT